ncbi:MAG: glycosyltransferase family 4 protein [Patescibacteria group bacterium]
MKICYIIDAWMPAWGGGQEHVSQVAKILKADIFHPKNDFFSFRNRVLFTLWTIKFYLTSDYDIYHSHTYSTNLFLPLVKLRGKKAVITLHGMGKNLIGGGILNKLKIPQFLMWLVLDVWPYDLRFSASQYKNYVVVGNGVNVEEYDKVKKIKHSKYTVFWIGRRYDPIKGVSFLEEAVKGLDVDLDIVENIYGDEKIKRFKSADLFVLPSLSEGFPIVLLEAMAAKLPIITTDVGDCRKLVEEAKCGLIVPPGDALKIREAILEIIKNKNDYGENGYKFVKNNYTWDKVATIYNSFYCGNNP